MARPISLSVALRAPTVVFAGLAASILVGTAVGPTLDAAEPNRAGVVVRASDDDVRKVCVAFDEPSISGAELLRRTGLDLELDRTSIGTAICSIDGTGCGSGDCFCRYPIFWGYWTGDDRGSWTFSQVGSADRKVRDGDVDGWSFGKDGKPPPSRVAFNDICTGDETPRPARAAASAKPRPSASAPNYLPFLAIALVLVLIGALAVRRRRR